jgi:hypothetical protein
LGGTVWWLLCSRHFHCSGQVAAQATWNSRRGRGRGGRVTARKWDCSGKTQTVRSPYLEPLRRHIHTHTRTLIHPRTQTLTDTYAHKRAHANTHSLSRSLTLPLFHSHTHTHTHTHSCPLKEVRIEAEFSILTGFEREGVTYIMILNKKLKLQSPKP